MHIPHITWKNCHICIHTNKHTCTHTAKIHTCTCVFACPHTHTVHVCLRALCMCVCTYEYIDRNVGRFEMNFFERWLLMHDSRVYISLHGVRIVPCLPSDAIVTNSTCKCASSASTNECAADKFCWTDNTCNDAMKPCDGDCPLPPWPIFSLLSRSSFRIQT